MTDLEPSPPNAPAPAPRLGRGRAVAIVALALLAGAATGALALYGMNGLPGNAPTVQPVVAGAPASSAAAADPGCAGAVAQARRLAPLARGDVAAVRLADAPRRVPDLAFTDASGRALTLADFRGKVLLVNLWATWCVPCREEMPALDALQETMGGPGFEVVAVNIDTRDPKKPRAFLDEIGVKALAFHADPATRSFQALRAVGRGFGLPTTLLVDAKGCEIGFLAGPAQWSGDDAKALIRAATAPAG